MLWGVKNFKNCKVTPPTIKHKRVVIALVKYYIDTIPLISKTLFLICKYVPLTQILMMKTFHRLENFWSILLTSKFNMVDNGNFWSILLTSKFNMVDNGNFWSILLTNKLKMVDYGNFWSIFLTSKFKVADYGANVAKLVKLRLSVTWKW